jgi:hypothetical protein
VDSQCQVEAWPTSDVYATRSLVTRRDRPRGRRPAPSISTQLVNSTSDALAFSG